MRAVQSHGSGSVGFLPASTFQATQAQVVVLNLWGQGVMLGNHDENFFPEKYLDHQVKNA